jgi:hypothetical protein
MSPPSASEQMTDRASNAMVISVSANVWRDLGGGFLPRQSQRRGWAPYSCSMAR